MAGGEDASTRVRELLDVAGLEVSDDEFDTFVRVYPALRAAADSLYLAEALEQDPSVTLLPIGFTAQGERP